MTDKILPLGSIVKVNHQEQKLVIIGRGQLFKKEGVIGYFDYSAVIYPNGVTGSDNFLFFNREDVAQVLFEGYRDEVEERVAQTYDEQVEKAGYPKLSVNK